MSEEQNWRTPIDGQDYFGAQKKRLNMAERRPAPRRASDLVGPGIDAHAIRITNFNAPLATFNGYYSATSDALEAPPETSSWVVAVSSDAELGGVQVATALATNVAYRRTFIRNVFDPDALVWTAWVVV